MLYAGYFSMPEKNAKEYRLEKLKKQGAYQITGL
jgi:hypothetical protein